MKVKVKFGSTEKEYDVISDPVPHILVDSKKKLHGWEFYSYPDACHRECSQERMLVNAYNGCWQNGCKGCAFCYTKGMRGYFEKFWKDNIATVFKDFDREVKKQIAKLHCCPTLYLSPVTDPFMDLEGKYHINKNMILDALEVNLPCEFITKMGANLLKWEGYTELIAEMAKHQHCFGQFTIYAREEVRKAISPGSSTVDEQLEAMKFCRQQGLFTVCRIDPFVPYVSDSEQDFDLIVANAKHAGARHVIASCADIPKKERYYFLHFFSELSKKFGANKEIFHFENLYRECITNDINASSEYRREKFQLLRDICDKYNLTFSLCMEFWRDENWAYRGFNDEFMSSTACEGREIPMYVRNTLGEKFVPLKGCDGNCLAMAKGSGKCNGACGYDRFEKAFGNKYEHYRAWDGIKLGIEKYIKGGK